MLLSRPHPGSSPLCPLEAVRLGPAPGPRGTVRAIQGRCDVPARRPRQGALQTSPFAIADVVQPLDCWVRSFGVSRIVSLPARDSHPGIANQTVE